MRPSLDCSKLNEPRQIAGLDFKLVVAVVLFFGYAAAMFKVPAVLIPPLLFLVFLRGPAKKDPAMIPIYLRHRTQRTKYAPAYVTAPNIHAPRPAGFNRLMEL